MKERIESSLAFKTNAWPLDPRKPTLVFIHGAGNSNVLWNSQLRGLDDRGNLLALDLPGHGRSPGTGYTAVPDYARVVMYFLIGEDDLLTPPKFGQYLADKIEGAQRVHLMDAGHLLPVEKPDELNQALLTFLN
jgi:pimeloyl-ACP methyl ester carboxylesterase